MSGFATTAPWWRPDARAAALTPVASPAPAGRTAFGGLLAFTFVLIVSPQAWVPVLGSLRVALVAAAVAIVAELLDRSMRHRPFRRTPTAFGIVLALVSWAVLTVPLSYCRAAAWPR